MEEADKPTIDKVTTPNFKTILRNPQEASRRLLLAVEAHGLGEPFSQAKKVIHSIFDNGGILIMGDLVISKPISSLYDLNVASTHIEITTEIDNGSITLGNALSNYGIVYVKYIDIQAILNLAVRVGSQEVQVILIAPDFGDSLKIRDAGQFQFLDYKETPLNHTSHILQEKVLHGLIAHVDSLHTWPKTFSSRTATRYIVALYVIEHAKRLTMKRK